VLRAVEGDQVDVLPSQPDELAVPYLIVQLASVAFGAASTPPDHGFPSIKQMLYGHPALKALEAGRRNPQRQTLLRRDRAE
jgi:hypothetical protein